MEPMGRLKVIASGFRSLGRIGLGNVPLKPIGSPSIVPSISATITATRSVAAYGSATSATHTYART
jgi:hypothetical protein